MQRAILAGVTVIGLVLSSVGAVHAGRLVYMGPDPACHFTQGAPQGPTASALAANAVRWAGNGGNPRILLVEADCGSDGLTMLQNAGFTDITAIAESSFASQTLSNFDVIYVTHSADASNFTSSAAAIQTFVNAGGGLVVEGHPSSYSWAPFGSLIGDTSNGSDVTTVVDPSHPVMAGLTNTGLSGWGDTSHGNFTTPQAGGFTTLAEDGESVPDIIARGPVAAPGVAAPALGWAGMVGLAVGLLSWGLYHQRRPRRL